MSLIQFNLLTRYIYIFVAKPSLFQHNWKVQDGYFVFEKTPIAPEKQSLDTSRIAKQMIYYAKQLEMIV